MSIHSHQYSLNMKYNPITEEWDKGYHNIDHDAWGRPKVINDFSLFHGVFTYSVPNRLWEEFSIATNGDQTPLTSVGTNVSSVDNMLEVRSGTTANQGAGINSKRHPRYQPNRGHLYSTACILPNATADGIRRFGLIKDGSGVYFELEGDGVDWTLYAVRKSNDVIKNRTACTLPAGFDPEKGHVYDIQYQWRGLGNYKFYIDLQPVHTEELLGTLTELSMRFPALPASYHSVTHTTTEIKIQAGCVDITSEGGKSEGRLFASVSTGTTLLNCDSTGTAMIGVKIPRDVSYGAGTIQNTRDVIASKLTAWTRDEASVQVYAARDTVATNLDGLTWTDFPDSTTQYLVGGTGSALQTAFALDKASMQLVLAEWHDIEQKNTVINPAPQDSPFFLTAGDILIVAVQSIAGVDENATTLYLSEEV